MFLISCKSHQSLPYDSMFGECACQIPYQQWLMGMDVSIQKWFPMAQSITPCPAPYYRNQVEFSCVRNVERGNFLVSTLRGVQNPTILSHSCLYIPQWMLDTIRSFERWWNQTALLPFNPLTRVGSLQTFLLREGVHTGDRLAMLTVSGNPRYALTRRQIDTLLQTIDDPQMSIFLRIQQIIPEKRTQWFEMHLCGPDHIREELHLLGRNLSFLISPSSPFLPHTLQAEAMYSKALAITPPLPLTYDLYCGIGALGVAMAMRGGAVIGVEENPYAVFDAQANVLQNQMERITIMQGDVEQVLSNRLDRVDQIMLSPPNSGITSSALIQIQQMQPRKILYISSNVESQAQDISHLLGYRIERVDPIDLGGEVRNLVLLRRKH